MVNGDMAGKNGDDLRLYQDVATAQLSERVTSQGRRLNDIEVEMRSGFAQLGTSLNASTNEMRHSIAQLSQSMAESRRPQWQALSVMLAGVVVLGGLLYWPIREATSRLETAVIALAEKTVPRAEIEWRSQRGAEDRKRTEDALAALRLSAVDRAEWLQQIHGRDTEVAELNRRVEEIRQNIGNQYTTRDLLLQLQQEVNDLRRRVSETARTRFPQQG